MSDLPERLRRAYDATHSNRVYDYSALREAADHIERLERQAAETEEWMRDNFPEMYR